MIGLLLYNLSDESSSGSHRWAMVGFPSALGGPQQTWKNLRMVVKWVSHWRSANHVCADEVDRI